MPTDDDEPEGLTTAEDWMHGGMGRDSAVFAFGRLAECLARTAFSGVPYPAPETTTVEAGNPLSVIEVHLEGGRAALYAGQAEDEYGLVCTHASFHITLALGYQPETGRVLGVYLCVTEGSLLFATRWAFRIVQTLEAGRRLHSHTPAPHRRASH